ncbi:hypothetical protein FOB63_003870 [Clavispora lusitaniae]|uniref:uncharacterized protein n=1 Tax=Clavispora lusitaniae TaxID=36911 RepID=UPI00202C660D|nr:hypothetical protein FOB63_003870 [Clavispora lusitaniae]
MFRILYLLVLCGAVSASIFNFMHDQYQHQEPRHEVSFEQRVLESNCDKYLCPGTLECVARPQDCPCPYPSSQMRCVLPNGDPLCISKPTGDYNGKYDDPAKNWKVDAKDDNVRDCGWVKRAWEGRV